MPRYNGTGPMGAGPMTGRGMGYCILERNEEKPSEVKGFIGLAGHRYDRYAGKGVSVGSVPVEGGTGSPRMETSGMQSPIVRFGTPFSGYPGRAPDGLVGEYIQAPLPGLTACSNPFLPAGRIPRAGYPDRVWIRGWGMGRGRRCGFPHWR